MAHIHAEIANSLVDAVESAEERLAAREGTAERQVVVAGAPTEVEDDALGLEELGDAVTRGSEEARDLMGEMLALLVQIAGVIRPATDQLNAATDRPGKAAVMLRVANDVKPLSVEMEAIGSRLEVRIAEIDSLLRSARSWRGITVAQR